MSPMRLPLWPKMLWTAGVLLWAPLYWKHYGAQNFLYFCDLGNFLIAAALWIESPLLFSCQAVGLLVFQGLFTVDLLGALVSGKHLFGASNFMFDPGVPLTIRLLSLFHVITPLVLLWAVWRLGYDPRGWKLQTLIAWIIVPVCHFWRPEHDVNWARGLFFREQHVMPGWLYLLGYLIVVPVLVYWPTHRALQGLMRWKGEHTAPK